MYLSVFTDCNGLTIKRFEICGMNRTIRSRVRDLPARGESNYMEDAAPGIGYVVLLFLMMPLLRGILYYRGVHKRALLFAEHSQEATAGTVAKAPSLAPGEDPIGEEAGTLVGTSGS